MSQNNLLKVSYIYYFSYKYLFKYVKFLAIYNYYKTLPQVRLILRYKFCRNGGVQTAIKAPVSCKLIIETRSEPDLKLIE